MEIIQTEWAQFVLKMLVAFILALPIGWNREKHTRIMGLRTFPLVALGSTAYVLVSLSILQDDLDAQARIIQGLITGIGFVGGGAILKNPAGSVEGTATAVSVWTTGAQGAGFGDIFFNHIHLLIKNNGEYTNAGRGKVLADLGILSLLIIDTRLFIVLGVKSTFHHSFRNLKQKIP